MFIRALILVSTLIPLQSFAWGGLGHRVTAAIAYQHLSAKAKVEAAHILNGEHFVNVATWADQIKKTPEWRQTRWYHFAKIEDGGSYLQQLGLLTPNMQDRGDIVMTLLKA